VNPNQRIVFGAWLAMIGLATVRSLGGGKGLPQPSVYLGSGVLFTMLMGAASFVGPLAATIAVGVDIAALVTPYIRGKTTGPLDQAAQALDKVAGGWNPAPAPGAAP
jgi:hypothetical protein